MPREGARLQGALVYPWEAEEAQVVDTPLQHCMSCPCSLFFLQMLHFSSSKWYFSLGGRKFTWSRSLLNPCICSYLCCFPCQTLNHEALGLIYSLKLSLVRPDPPQLGQETSETFGASWPNLILHLNTCSCLFWQR